MFRLPVSRGKRNPQSQSSQPRITETGSTTGQKTTLLVKPKSSTEPLLLMFEILALDGIPVGSAAYWKALQPHRKLDQADGLVQPKRYIPQTYGCLDSISLGIFLPAREKLSSSSFLH